MANIRAASRYAKAILKLGVEQNKVEVIQKDMECIQSALASSVKLTTATPLNEGVKGSIEKALLDSNVTDKEVDVESIVDEDIIGGFVIEVGDKLYDASVLHKLNKVRKEFSQNKYIKSF